jgi:hypothetical protein
VSDPYIAAIIDSVESGGDPVLISVALKSGAVITGYVRAAQFFADATRNETRRVRQAAAAAKAGSHDMAFLTRQQDRIAAIYENFDNPGSPEAVTLSDVTMIWNNGDGMKLHTVRLGFDAIAAWWVAQGTPIKGEKDTGGFWAVGVAF